MQSKHETVKFPGSIMRFGVYCVTRVQLSLETRGSVRSPTVGVTGGGEPPNMSAGN